MIFQMTFKMMIMIDNDGNDSNNDDTVSND